MKFKETRKSLKTLKNMTEKERLKYYANNMPYYTEQYHAPAAKKLAKHFQ